jgi:hypothetical protein
MSKNDNDNNVINDSILRSFDGDVEGVARFEVRDGREVFTNDKVERWEESEAAETSRRGGDNTFMITTQSGRVVQPGAGVTDDMLVRLPGGMQTTIAVALMQGLVSRSADGSIHMDENEIISKNSAPPQQQHRQQPTIEAFSDHGAEGLLRAVEDTVDHSDHVAVFRELSDTGTVSSGLIGRIASQMQVTPGEAGQYVTRILGAFEKQAHSAISSAAGGVIDATEVLDWAKANAPRELREAFEGQFKSRSTAAYRGLVQKYVLGLEKSDPAGVMQIATEAGLQPRYEKSAGVVIVTMPNGQSMTFSQALQMNLISLTGRR